MVLEKASADFLKKLATSGSGLCDIAFKDENNGRWLFYDATKDTYTAHPFGSVSLFVINTAVTLSPSNPNHEHDLAVYRENGISEVFLQSVMQNANNPSFQKGLNDLKGLLLSMTAYKAGLSENAFDCAAVNFWYKFAYFYDFEGWVYCFSDVNEKKVDTFPDTEACAAYMRFNSLFGDRCAECVETTIIIDGEAVTGRVFRLNRAFGIGCLFPMDLLHLFKNSDAIRICTRCGQMYVKKNASSRYCPQCKEETGKIANENRKKNKARYLHKRILDKLNSPANTTGVNAEYFKAESNYYWAKICGKKPKTVPPVANPNTDTEEEYIKWLNSILPNPYMILKDKYPKK